MFEPKDDGLYMINRESPPVRPSVKEEPKFEIKALPPHLKYVFLGICETQTAIIKADVGDK